MSILLSVCATHGARDGTIMFPMWGSHCQRPGTFDWQPPVCHPNLRYYEHQEMMGRQQMVAIIQLASSHFQSFIRLCPFFLSFTRLCLSWSMIVVVSLHCTELEGPDRQVSHWIFIEWMLFTAQVFCVCVYPRTLFLREISATITANNQMISSILFCTDYFLWVVVAWLAS